MNSTSFNRKSGSANTFQPALSENLQENKEKKPKVVQWCLIISLVKMAFFKMA
jgi:hypothetical protein